MAFSTAAFRATTAVRWAFRGNMTSKRGNAGFYKGRGAPSMGHIAKGKDRFIVDRVKYARNTFHVPNLKGFKLKAYIAPQTDRYKVPRPQLIVSVDLRTKMFQEKQIRVAKMNSLIPILKGTEVVPKSKLQRSKKKFHQLRNELTIMKERRVKATQRQQARAKTRVVLRTQRAEARLKREAKLAQFKEEIATRHQAYIQGKRGEELPQISPQAARYQKYKDAERFKTFLQLRQRKLNKHITNIKATTAQQQNV